VRTLSSKSVFVAMKWLVFLHTWLQLSSQQGSMASVESLLGQV
jgi:hypothetical protein